MFTVANSLFWTLDADVNTYTHNVHSTVAKFDPTVFSNIDSLMVVDAACFLFPPLLSYQVKKSYNPSIDGTPDNYRAVLPRLATIVDNGSCTRDLVTACNVLKG